MSLNLKKYQEMSPFEMKNELIDLAKKFSKKTKLPIYDAGRGNPNFLNTTVRTAFSYFSIFAAEESLLLMKKPKDLGLNLHPKNLGKKFEKFLQEAKKHSAFSKKALDFLEDAFLYIKKNLRLDFNQFVYEIAQATLGDHYPMRIYPNMEKVILKFLEKILGEPQKEISSKQYDLFATEGATGAMLYLFRSLQENFILNPGDSIAIFTPIFSPYLEIPSLKEFQLKEVLIQADQSLEWQIQGDDLLQKLKNPKIKALYLVNPTNPTAVCLDDPTLKKIIHLVKTERKDLILIADHVYAPFIKGFHSLFKNLPYHTISVFSYSKYFGVTGWRLGTILMNKKNIVDDRIKKLPLRLQKKLHERYKVVTASTQAIKFIDRLLIDSREPPLAHTAGLSSPQQCMMTLFSLFELLDNDFCYRKSLRNILTQRIFSLYQALGIPFRKQEKNTFYYTLLNISDMARIFFGKEFQDYLIKRDPLEFIFRLAKEKQTICLPGKGFAAPEWSLRISLANLDENAYKMIGRNIKSLLKEMHQEWIALKKKNNQ